MARATPAAKITVWIPGPEPLVANDDTYVAEYGKAFSPPAGQLVIANDSNPNPDPIAKVTYTSALSDPAAGTLTRVQNNGNFTFTGAPGWAGTVTFNYTFADPDIAAGAPATVTIVVPAPPPPVAADDSYVCAFGQEVWSVATADGLLANDTSPVNLTISVVGSPTPSDGTLAVNADGSFDWTPPNSLVVIPPRAAWGRVCLGCM